MVVQPLSQQVELADKEGVELEALELLVVLVQLIQAVVAEVQQLLVALAAPGLS